MFAGDPDAFWRWSREGQARALAWYRLRLATPTSSDAGGGEPITDTPPEMCRWASIAPATLGDLAQLVSRAYAPRARGSSMPLAEYAR